MDTLKEIPAFNYIILFLVSLWSAYINFIRRKEKGEIDTRNKIFVFLQDLIMSSGTTIIFYYMMVGYDINEVFAVGFGGYLGSQSMRSLNLFELYLINKLNKR